MYEVNCEARAGDRIVQIPVPGPERTIERFVDLSPDHTPRPVVKVGIIGATSIGVDLAMRLLDAGIPVTLLDRERASLDKALAHSREHDAATNSEPATGTRFRRVALLAATLYFHHLKDCDLIIDTVATEIGVKEKLFRLLDEVARPNAILVACNSSPDIINYFAGITRRQGEVLGLRFLSPATEIDKSTFVRGRGTSGDTLATVTALFQKLHKVSAAGSQQTASLGAVAL